MPAPTPRDPEATQAVLEGWLAQRLPGAHISNFETPQSNGFSSETVLFDVTHEGVTEALVARIEPVHYQVFPDPRFDDQYRLMQTLDVDTDIPVPPIRWFEPDVSYLGAPFIVMGRVDGVVPADVPSYHQQGWLADLPPAGQATVWWSPLEIMARLHRLDAKALDLEFLDQPEFGPAGIEQRLGYFENYMHWAYPGPKDSIQAALAWLKANQPVEPHDPVLLWGDARMGNVLYVDGLPSAVLDWENATFGQPEEDLAWYLYLDRFHSDGIDVPRLPGLPTPEETIARFGATVGRPMLNMPYYEVLSAFKFAVILSRIGNAMIEFNWMDGDADFPYNNPSTRLLDKIMGDLK